MRLQSLSDQEILTRIHHLAARERSLTRLVLLHLNEIERRRLHLKQGYASMFDYCTTGLGYSASAAMRRVKTARCVARFPLVDDLLRKNEVNLSTIAQVCDALTEKNHRELLSRIRSKSQREVETILAEYRPCAQPRERVRTIVVRVPASPVRAAGDVAGSNVSGAGWNMRDGAPSVVATAPASSDGPPLPLSTEHCEKSDYYRNGSGDSPTSSEERVTIPEHVEKRSLLQFSVKQEFMAKLERIKSLAWHRLPANPSLEQVFDFVMNCYIAKEDPAARRERRRVREDVSTENVKTPDRQAAAQHGGSRGRYVAAALKDEVFTRDQGRCTYVGATGKRCTSTRALQIDHVQPIARGGEGNAGNLRLLCAYHNRLEAERILGSMGNPTPRGLRL